jgi:hypothetical protein
MKHAIAALLVPILAACGPMSPERAADVCEDRARAAQGPTAEIGIGVGSGGTSGSVEVGVTSDYLRGRDPYVVYDECVRQKTGQGPIRPLDLR